MPPRRPNSHVNADICIAKLHSAFNAAGWTVEELHKDYGEDLQVRIFEDGQATPHVFFVQAKHVEDPARHQSKDGRFISYPFQRHHLEIWQDFWEPVVLTLWDVKSDQLYWDIAQSLEWPPTSKATQRCTVRFPSDNILDSDGLARIKSRTISRYQRLEIEQRGAEILIGRIRELFDVKIDYNPRIGQLAITLPNGEADLTVWGRFAERLEIEAAKTGQELGDYYFDLMMAISKLTDRIEQGDPFPIRNSDGSFKYVTGIEEVTRQLQRQTELTPDSNEL
ncbi:DUF4365 domain-containing protein [Nocardia carnea]|uniref:DUF4365 domain-containing protein n=1 Tax=Nocardia carnea TaxID=37328 RepID=UPI002457B9F8|nr:DUF4365 domain-containing protein [Nocardia carnea]